MRSVEQDWRRFLLTADPAHHSLRALFRFLPHDPRCTSCAAPFAGWGSRFASALGFVRFDKNPRWCSRCFSVLQRKERGGAEIELSMLFADVRGSTPLGERLSASELHRVMDRFYDTAIKAAIDRDALIERFMGDQVVAYFVPGFAGTGTPRRPSPRDARSSARPVTSTRRARGYRSASVCTPASPSSARSEIRTSS